MKKLLHTSGVVEKDEQKKKEDEKEEDHNIRDK